MVSPIDLLNTHAEMLCESGEDKVPLSSDDPELTALMALAERVKAALTPVRPTPAFVEALGRELAQTEAPAVEVLPTRRRPWIIGAAAVGSALSFLGLFHLLRGGRVLRKVS